MRIKNSWADSRVSQQLRALAALAEDPDLVSSTHMTAQNQLQGISRGSDALFWPLMALHTCDAQTFMKANYLYS